MDVIYSGLEASPWGLMGYGFEQFAGMRSGNSVSALSAYWIEHTGQIIEFEKANSDRCIRVRYESLVQDPERVSGEIFSFLGAGPAPGITSHCFTPDPTVTGPGDHKIRATRKITADSVGRGVRVPVGMIPPPQLKMVNHLLTELDYTRVDDAWQRSAYPPALLRNGTASSTGEPESGAPVSLGDGVVLSVLEKLGKVVDARVRAGFIQQLPSADLPRIDGTRQFALVAYHSDHHRVARSWRVDLANRTVTQAANADDAVHDVDWLITADVETWLGVLADRMNMAACMRSGAMRYVGLRKDDRQAGEIQESDLLAAGKLEKRLQVVRELLGLTGYPEEVAGPALIG